MKVVIKSSLEAIAYIRPLWTGIEHRESVYAMYLNRANAILGYYQIAFGEITSASADVRLIFQAALLSNAVQYILFHNHPSGSLKPSEEDILLTKLLVAEGNIMRIKIVDHIILTAERYTSFADEGLL